MARLEFFFPKLHAKPRVDAERLLSGVILFIRNGLAGVLDRVQRAVHGCPAHQLVALPGDPSVLRHTNGRHHAPWDGLARAAHSATE